MDRRPAGRRVGNLLHLWRVDGLRHERRRSTDRRVRRRHRDLRLRPLRIGGTRPGGSYTRRLLRRLAPDLKRSLIAEGIGTALLLAAVVGSGIMAERLSGGNNAIALLANAIATGAALYPLILSFDGLSGAHFNPAVSLVMGINGEIGRAHV